MGLSGNVRARRRRSLSSAVTVLEARYLLLASANLQAFRPVTPHIDSSSFPVSDADEASATKGAGIRVNGDDDNKNGQADYLDLGPLTTADDDLIRVDISGNGSLITLSWTGSLAVWTTPLKDAAIINGSAVSHGQTVWVEYTSQTHTAGVATQLKLLAEDGPTAAFDLVTFHSFQSVVIAIAGFTQDPSQFGDPNVGVYTIAGELYSEGYDVQLYAHSDVIRTGSKTKGKGKVYDDTVSAVLNRNVNSVAVIGYSWGAGAVINLANALKKTKTLAPAGYRLVYTASIDGIRHGGLTAETRKPVGTLYHDNVYQRKDFIPRGNKVKKANLNLNVTTTTWGSLLGHVTIDDDPTVEQLILDSLKARVIA